MSAQMRNAVGLSILGFAGLVAAGCDEPMPKCNIARGQFAAKYTLVSATGTPECAQLPGDMLNIDIYYQAVSKKDPQPDVDHAFVGLEPQGFVGPLSNAGSQGVMPNPADQAYTFGPFKETYPKDGICTVPMMSSGRVRLPVVPEHMDMSMDSNMNACLTDTPEQPSIDATYTLSNLRVYVTVVDNGTQFSADLEYTTPTCSAKYTVWAVSPVVSCGTAMMAGDAGMLTSPDAEAELPTPTGNPADGGVADASPQGMDAAADIDAAGASADGAVALSPCPVTPSDPMMPDDTTCATSISDFATACDPNLLVCVPTKETPSLK